MSFFDNFLNILWMIIGWILSMWLKGECSWMNFVHDGIGMILAMIVAIIIVDELSWDVIHDISYLLV